MANEASEEEDTAENVIEETVSDDLAEETEEAVSVETGDVSDEEVVKEEEANDEETSSNNYTSGQSSKGNSITPFASSGGFPESYTIQQLINLNALSEPPTVSYIVSGNASAPLESLQLTEDSTTEKTLSVALKFNDEFDIVAGDEIIFDLPEGFDFVQSNPPNGMALKLPNGNVFGYLTLRGDKMHLVFNDEFNGMDNRNLNLRLRVKIDTKGVPANEPLVVELFGRTYSFDVFEQNSGGVVDPMTPGHNKRYLESAPRTGIHGRIGWELRINNDASQTLRNVEITDVLGPGQKLVTRFAEDIGNIDNHITSHNIYSNTFMMQAYNPDYNIEALDNTVSHKDFCKLSESDISISPDLKSFTLKLTEINGVQCYIYYETEVVDEDIPLDFTNTAIIKTEGVVTDELTYTSAKAYDLHGSGSATPRYTLNISKIDGDTNQLITNSPAKFQLVRVRDGYTLPEKQTSNGIATFTGIVAGEYLIIETQAPSGYGIALPKTITIPNNIGTTSFNAVIENYKSGTFKLTKIDAKTNEPILKVARFVIKRYSDVERTDLIQDYYSQTNTSDGQFWEENLPRGYYTVEEIGAPLGYVIDRTPRAFTIGIDSPEENPDFLNPEMEFDNQPRTGTITITKVDDDSTGSNQIPLEGVEFELYLGNSMEYRAVTNATGIAEFSNVPAGTYILKEKNTLPQYELLEDPIEVIVGLNNSNPNIVATESGTIAYSHELEIRNKKKLVSVKLTKINGDTNEILRNIDFDLFDLNQTPEILVDTYRTDANGEIEIANRIGQGPLTFGRYKFVEKTPAGYLPSEPIDITITDTDYRIQKEVPNYLAGTIKLTKIQENMDARIKGAKFKLEFNDNGTFVQQPGTYTTNDDGEIFISDLARGEYRLTEIEAAFGYYLNESPITFIVDYNNQLSINTEINNEAALNHDVKFTNEQIIGNVKLTKIDGFDPSLKLSNVKFNLYRLGANGEEPGTLIQEYTTDANGEITISNLPAGNYKLREISALPGYFPNIEPIRFTIGVNEDGSTNTVSRGIALNHELTYINEPYLGEVNVLKVDNVTNLPLQGVRFSLSKEVSPNQYDVVESERVTNALGEIKFENLRVGKYRLTEISPFPGYAPLTAPIDFTIGKNDGDRPIDRTIPPPPISPGEPIPDEPNASLKYNYTVKNREINGTFKLFKYDTEMPIKLLPGVVFELRKLNVATEEYEYVNSLTTDASGSISATNLKQGDYQLIEVTAAPGYYLDKTPITFRVDASGVSNVELTGGISEDHTFFFPNKLIQGEFELTKVDETDSPLPNVVFEFSKWNEETDEYEVIDELTTDAAGKISKNELLAGEYRLVELETVNGYYLKTTPITFTVAQNDEEAVNTALTGGSNDKHAFTFTNELILGEFELTKVDLADNTKVLAGVTFELSKWNAATSEYEIIAELTTDAAGKITKDELLVGDYQLIEVVAATGYYLNKTPITFTVAQNDDEAVNTALTGGSNDQHAFTFTNELILGEFELTKVDLADDTKVLAGATFELSMWNASTSEYEVIAELTTDAAGKITKDELLAGDYQLIEVAAATGYYLNETPITFTVAQNDDQEVNKALTGGSNDKHAFTFTNELILGEFELTKVDLADDTKVLAGATFELSKWNEATSAFELVSKLTTNANGKISKSKLLAGDYQLIEVKAAPGYFVNKTPITFAIAENKQLDVNTALTGGSADKHAFTFTNELILGEFELTKVDAANRSKKLANVTFELSKWNRTTQAYEKIANLTTGANGKIYYKKLLAGRYMLVESVAAKGYELDATPIKFTIGDNGDGSINTKLTDGKAVVHQFIFTNKLKPVPPLVNPDDIKKVEDIIIKYNRSEVLSDEELNELKRIYDDYLKMTDEEKREFERLVDVEMIRNILNGNQTLPQTDGKIDESVTIAGLLFIYSALTMILYRRYARKHRDGLKK